jgi:hypothetical protein
MYCSGLGYEHTPSDDELAMKPELRDRIVMLVVLHNELSRRIDELDKERQDLGHKIFLGKRRMYYGKKSGKITDKAFINRYMSLPEDA